MMQKQAVPSLRETLRIRASVLETFEVSWLGIPEVVADSDGAIDDRYRGELVQFLLRDASRVDASEELGTWVVHDHVRRSASAAGFSALQEAWGHSRSLNDGDQRPQSTMQQALDDLFNNARFILHRDDQTLLQSEAQIARWFEQAGDPIPAYAEIEAAVSLAAMLDPLRDLVGEYFRGRDLEMERLDGLLQGQTLYVKGGGGIGKSALVGKYVLEEFDRGAAISYLNFDHSALDATEPASLVAAMTRQLSWQIEEFAQLQYLENEAADLVKFGDSLSNTGSRAVKVSGDRWASLLLELVDQLAGRPLVVVLDTMEQAQRRDWELRMLRRFVAELTGLNCRVIASGRGEVSGYDLLPLSGLPVDDAVDLLDALLRDHDLAGQPVELDSTRLYEIAEMSGGSPLCMRLAAGIIRTTEDPTGWFAEIDLTSGLLEGELYRRLLSHIDDDEIRALAYPGLALRVVTPTLVRNVLSVACNIQVESDSRAKELFDGLAREGMLVERQGEDRIVHRSDVRPLMIRRLTHDHQDEVRLIHELAVEYYRGEGAASPDAATEGLYHQLMLGTDLEDLVDIDLEVLRELSLSSDEFPTPTLAWLVDQNLEIDVRISQDELANIEMSKRRPLVQAEVERMLNIGDLVGASELLATNRGDDGQSILPSIEIQVFELTGFFAQAAELAETEQRRSMTSGDLAATVEYALHRARIWERIDQVQSGADHLVQLHKTVLNSESPAITDLMRLRVITVLLRLVRLGADVEDGDFTTNAVELFDRIPRTELNDNPALLRDLVAELGADAPTRLMTLALDAGVISDDDGELVEILQDLDGRVSSARGRDHGVVAEMAQVAVDSEGSADWENWIGTGASSKAATQVGRIIEQFEPEESEDLRGAIARQYRQASDDAYGVTF